MGGLQTFWMIQIMICYRRSFHSLRVTGDLALQSARQRTFDTGWRSSSQNFFLDFYLCFFAPFLRPGFFNTRGFVHTIFLLPFRFPSSFPFHSFFDFDFPTILIYFFVIFDFPPPHFSSFFTFITFSPFSLFHFLPISLFILLIFPVFTLSLVH